MSRQEKQTRKSGNGERSFVPLDPTADVYAGTQTERKAEAGTVITLPTVPTWLARSGYTFAGWQVSDTENAKTGHRTLTEGTEFKAVWENLRDKTTPRIRARRFL